MIDMHQRRNAVRLNLISVQANIWLHHADRSVMCVAEIIDISAIGVLVQMSTELHMGQPVRCCFKADNTFYSVSGLVIRMETVQLFSKTWRYGLFLRISPRISDSLARWIFHQLARRPVR